MGLRRAGSMRRGASSLKRRGLSFQIKLQTVGYFSLFKLQIYITVLELKQ